MSRTKPCFSFASAICSSSRHSFLSFALFLLRFVVDLLLTSHTLAFCHTFSIASNDTHCFVEVCLPYKSNYTIVIRTTINSYDFTMKYLTLTTLFALATASPAPIQKRAVPSKSGFSLIRIGIALLVLHIQAGQHNGVITKSKHTDEITPIS
jgi:hypothetical protein